MVSEVGESTLVRLPVKEPIQDSEKAAIRYGVRSEPRMLRSITSNP